MSDMPLNNAASVSSPSVDMSASGSNASSRGPYGVAGNSSDQRANSLIKLEPVSSPIGSVPAVSVVFDSGATSPTLGAALLGLVLVIASGLLAVWPSEQVDQGWKSLTTLLQAESSAPVGGDTIASILNASYAAQATRYVLALLVGLVGATLLHARFVLWITTAALFAAAAYCADALLHEQLAGLLSQVSAAEGFAWRFGVVACLALGVLVQSGPRAAKLTGGSVLSFALVAVASLGAVKNWYQWDVISGRIGPATADFFRQWGEECTWAIVLILTAIGIASSRSRTVHFLNAIILLALSYHCVKTGYAELRTFPELSANAATPISIEEISIRNVEPWRWMVGLELSCLAAVLLHMSMGIGILNLAYAVMLMAAGLAMSHSVGTMSLVRAGNDAIGKSAQANPLFNMGLPVGDPRASAQPRTPPLNASSELPPRASTNGNPNALTPEQLRARQAVEVQLSREGAVREIAPFVWIMLTAVIAGIVAVTGLRLLIADPRHRSAVAMLLVFSFGVVAALLWSAWPRNPHQSWSAWLAAFKLSRYHAHAVWLVFLGAMAVAGSVALHPSSKVLTWIHACVALVLVGTMGSMVAAAMLIQFGNFPQLPVWVYAVVAAAQSSLAWVLLMHLNFSARSPQHRTAIAR